ncbi:putative rRNA processing protein Ipi1 [Tricharina praecox]|uniref:putative rRNA processing protein Ipi1 n=1 Tax=Tricharina praecox TaxID=43433 RepID=UPI00221EBC14|nr:putative rRNA processing protein Ipi1 [Tricharina praecox]KAI5858004.1 putative rRNA processing protein Ipi1 [Tricharina praecox]
MTSSNKKKRAKIADFKKQKLRVGKTPAQSANFTPTSFRTKAIVLASQNVHHVVDITAQFQHHVTLLSHHTPATRKDSLHYLSLHLPSSPLPSAILLPKLAPLIQDPSSSVRAALLSLLTTLPARDARLHLPPILLHIWSAISHIQPDVRADSTGFLQWALRAAPRETLAHGGWEKGLIMFVGLMGFGDASVAAGSKGAKAVLRHLGVLREFLEVGCPGEGEGGGDGGRLRRAGAAEFRYLGLFEVGDGEGPEDAEGRRRWCREKGGEAVRRLRRGLDGLAKEGGEVGRAAGRVVATLEGVLEVREE